MAEENYSQNFDKRIATIERMAEAVYRRLKATSEELNRQTTEAGDTSQKEWLLAEFERLPGVVADIIRSYKDDLR